MVESQRKPVKGMSQPFAFQDDQRANELEGDAPNNCFPANRFPVCRESESNAEQKEEAEQSAESLHEWPRVG